MHDYRVRPATRDDVDVLVHHRTAMFEDMGVPLDRETLAGAFRPWVLEMMSNGTYRAWVVDHGADVVAGGGISIVPWPPGPHDVGGRLAFVYNVYTEPDHRHRGLGRMVMDAIHEWCRAERIGSLALNASRFGRPLYESLGYSVTPNPMMFLALEWHSVSGVA